MCVCVCVCVCVSVSVCARARRLGIVYTDKIFLIINTLIVISLMITCLSKIEVEIGYFKVETHERSFFQNDGCHLCFKFLLFNSKWGAALDFNTASLT